MKSTTFFWDYRTLRDQNCFDIVTLLTLINIHAEIEPNPSHLMFTKVSLKNEMEE